MCDLVLQAMLVWCDVRLGPAGNVSMVQCAWCMVHGGWCMVHGAVCILLYLQAVLSTVYRVHAINRLYLQAVLSTVYIECMLL
jgi:hypothetical protein